MSDPGQVTGAIQVVDMILNLMIIPATGVLWKLASTIKDLKFAIYTEFVTKAEFERRMSLVETANHAHEIEIWKKAYEHS